MKLDMLEFDLKNAIHLNDLKNSIHIDKVGKNVKRIAQRWTHEFFHLGRAYLPLFKVILLLYLLQLTLLQAFPSIPASAPRKHQ